MRALILAGGFGTRLSQGIASYHGAHSDFLSSCVANRSKGLVEIRGKPLVSYQLEQLTQAGVSRESVYVLSNDIHLAGYQAWASEQGIPASNVFSNGTKDLASRREQVGDMIYGLRQIANHDQPLFLLACDTIVYGSDGSLYDLGAFHQSCGQHSGVVTYFKPQQACNHGVVSFDEAGMLTGFVEKPKGVEQGHVNASIYFLQPAKIAQIIDAQGPLTQGTYKNFLEVLACGFRVGVAASRLDIGTLEDVLRANELLVIGGPQSK